jgi:hypothetical protein
MGGGGLSEWRREEADEVLRQLMSLSRVEMSGKLQASIFTLLSLGYHPLAIIKITKEIILARKRKPKLPLQV